MIRTIWISALALVGATGVTWAGPPGHGGHSGGHAGGHGGGSVHYSGGGYRPGVSVGVGYGGLGVGYSNGRGLSVGLNVPLYSAPRPVYPVPLSQSYYNTPSFQPYYAQPAYPQYVPPSSAILRSPANAPGGVFVLPPFGDTTAPQPPAIPPANPLDQNPGTFPYDGGPASPIPLPTPDTKPPAPKKPQEDGVKVSLRVVTVSKPGYAFPAYAPK